MPLTLCCNIALFAVAGSNIFCKINWQHKPCSRTYIDINIATLYKMGCKISQFFKRIRIVAKISYYLHVCPFTRPHVQALLPFDGFVWISYRECLYKSVKKFQICQKSGTNIGRFAWKPKNVLLLMAILRSHKAFSSTETVSGCYDRRAGIDVTRRSNPLPGTSKTTERSTYPVCYDTIDVSAKHHY